MATVTIPLLYKELTGGTRETEVPAATVGEIVAEMLPTVPESTEAERPWPGSRRRALAAKGFKCPALVQ